MATALQSFMSVATKAGVQQINDASARINLLNPTGHVMHQQF